VLNNPFFKFAEEPEEERQEFLKYPDIINKIVALEGLVIEIIGDWIWLSGNTYPYRKILKETGFLFASKKVMWFYRPAEYKSSNRSPMDIDSIRSKYGSNKIDSEPDKRIYLD
jgi:hypothetical protein